MLRQSDHYRILKISNTPSYTWSQNDWAVFRAACRPTRKQLELQTELVTAIRLGARPKDLATPTRTKQRVYQILSAAYLKEQWIMQRFYERRRNLGRPLDLPGPRDVWIDYDIIEGNDLQ